MSVITHHNQDTDRTSESFLVTRLTIEMAFTKYVLPALAVASTALGTLTSTICLHRPPSCATEADNADVPARYEANLADTLRFPQHNATVHQQLS